MTFRLDSSDSSVVVVCTCGWRGIAFDRVAAWTTAREHERRGHPGQCQARDRLNTALSRARHAGL